MTGGVFNRSLTSAGGHRRMFEQQGISPFPPNLAHQPGRRDHLGDRLDDADLLDYHSLLDAGDNLDDHSLLNHGHLDNGHFATNLQSTPRRLTSNFFTTKVRG